MICFMDDDRIMRLAAWGSLARELGGSFSARVRGVVSPEVILLTPDGGIFGRLVADEAGGRRLRAGDVSARIETQADGRYRMATAGAEVLDAGASGSATALELRSGDQSYGASISLLRNSATARSSDGTEAVRISGGLTNRRYRATFDPEDPASLPVAVFLLDRLFTLRRDAFRVERP